MQRAVSSGRHPCRGFVQDEQFRVSAEGNGNLQNLLISMGKGAAHMIPLDRPGPPFQNLVPFPHWPAFLKRRKIERLPLLGKDGDPDIFKDSESGKIFTTWKDRVIPFLQIRWAESPVISSPLNRILPPSGLKYSRDQVKKGRLPRTVWADDCNNLSLLHIEMGPINRHEAAERFPNSFDLQHLLLSRREGFPTVLISN